MHTSRKIDTVVSQPPTSQRHVWTLPPAPKGPAARFWDNLMERIGTWCEPLCTWLEPQRLVVEPPEWFSRAQTENSPSTPVAPQPKSNARREPVQPRPSLPMVNLPG